MLLLTPRNISHETEHSGFLRQCSYGVLDSSHWVNVYMVTGAGPSLELDSLNDSLDALHRLDGAQ